MDLQGRIAVVTGASSGIGEASALALADRGVRVVAVARRTERLEALAARQPLITAHAADVTDDHAVRELAAAVAAAHGACHILVNNAGFSAGAHFRGAEDLETLAAVLDVNLTGVARCMAAFADLLAASAPARVINVASVAGKIGIGPPAYAASKFALVGFCEAVRPDWERRGIAVTQLNPGFVRTEGFTQEKLRGTPFAPFVIGPQEVAEAVVDVAVSGVRERTVPRWYRGLTVLRHVAAPAFWGVARRAV